MKHRNRSSSPFIRIQKLYSFKYCTSLFEASKIYVLFANSFQQKSSQNRIAFTNSIKLPRGIQSILIDKLSEYQKIRKPNRRCLLENR